MGLLVLALGPAAMQRAAGASLWDQIGLAAPDAPPTKQRLLRRWQLMRDAVPPDVRHAIPEELAQVENTQIQTDAKLEEVLRANGFVAPQVAATVDEAVWPAEQPDARAATDAMDRAVMSAVEGKVVWPKLKGLVEDWKQARGDKITQDLQSRQRRRERSAAR